MSDDYLARLRAAVDDHEDVLAVMWELYPKLREDLRAGVDELERLRKDVAKLGEHVAPVDDREPMDVNWAAEALYAYAEQRSTQSQFGNQLRAVLDSRQSWRYRAFKLEDDVEQLRTQVANFPDLLADAQEMALDKLVEAFGEGYDNCRMHLDDEARRGRDAVVGQYSNQLSWPAYAASQQSERDDSEVPS